MTTTPQAITALVVPCDGTPAHLTSITPDLDTLQRLVGGDIEALNLTGDAAVYLAQEGKFLGLPVNAAMNRLVAVAQVGLHPGDFIVGQCVVTGSRNRAGRADGGDHDVPASVLDLCARAGVEVLPPPGP